jgi:hypothetical protein
MASSIGLFRHTGQGRLDIASADPHAMNIFRLRIVLILLESRWESIADRKPISPEFVELTDFEFDNLSRIHPLSPEALLAADYALHRFEVSGSVRSVQSDADRHS